MDTLDLDKISIVSTNLAEIRDYFVKMLAAQGKPALVITFNLEIYRNALINNDAYLVCRNAELVLPDGISIAHLLKLKYKKEINRITGTDLFETILNISSEMPLSVAFVGSSEKVIEALSAKVKSLYPNCRIAAAISPAIYFEKNAAENNSVLEELKKASPDILFIALNNSRGELWLSKYKDQIGAKINIGVGAVFDFYTGNKKRSPVFFQRLSLEWAWRLSQEPKRLFKRYLIHGVPFFLKKAVRIIFKNDI